MGDERLEVREDILKKITSSEAHRVTRQISVLYLRLLRAPSHLWKSESVLRLAGELRDGQPISAWEQLIDLVKVSPRTARKAVTWLHDEGVINFSTTEDKGEIIIAFEGVSGSARRR